MNIDIEGIAFIARNSFRSMCITFFHIDNDPDFPYKVTIRNQRIKHYMNIVLRRYLP